MPDIPKDPRQLARDILAGKISLEDLAREQARRRGNVPGSPPPMARPPVARPAPASPGSESRMPAPVPMQKRPPVQPAPQQQRRPAPQPPVRRPPPASARGPNIVVNTPAPPVATPAASVPAVASVAKPNAPARKAAQASFLSTLKNRSTLRQGILIAEVLNKPVSLRDD